jgi:Mrp family chromosome partitioning ATPase
MSTLDQAFIKAYTKGTAAARHAVPEPQPVVTEQLYADGPVYRVDASHPGPAGQASPAAGTAPSGTYSERAGVVPYQDLTLPPVIPVVDADFGTRCAAPADCPPAPLQPGMRGTVWAAAPPALAPAGLRPSPSAAPPMPWPTEESRQTLLAAAQLKLPPTLELPSVFGPPADPSSAARPAEPAAPPFASDWEVDHFAWPDVCQWLLHKEAKYFRHVGQRLKAATQDQHHLLLVTGSCRGEGRTTLALCLARCAAQAGVRVALVDADVKNPQVAAQLGMEAPRGWSEVALDRAPLTEAAVASVEDGVTLFPFTSVAAEDRPPDDGRLRDILRQIAHHFPLVIVDAGPLSADTQPLLTNADSALVSAAIVVRDLRCTTEKKALATAEQLQQAGIPAVGIAENFTATS